MKFRQTLVDESATVTFGERLSQAIMGINGGICIHLSGELGAGKTTLTRGIVMGLGHDGPVKSPTYTLVEPYQVGKWDIYHFDLYRLADPEELEYMGIRDYFTSHSIAIIEWPQRGEGVIPDADLWVTLRSVGLQREVTITSFSDKGKLLLQSVKAVCY